MRTGRQFTAPITFVVRIRAYWSSRRSLSRGDGLFPARVRDSFEKVSELKDSAIEVTISGDPHEPPPEPQKQAMLVSIAGPGFGQRKSLGEEPVELGRGVRCSWVIDSDSVSRRHAVVERCGDAHQIRDLGSTNGTYVNDERIQVCVLGDGDRVQVGKSVLKYLAGGNIESAYHEEIQRLMRFDGLTGVANRSHYEDALRIALQRDRVEPSPISLLLLDLDYFKSINDRFGHVAGDAVLRQFAATVSCVVPQPWFLARLGGEEFAILCPGTSVDGARALAERIRSVVADARFEFDGQRISLTVSIGLADRAPASRDGAADLYERADERLYAAKSAGRNCVR